MFRRKQISKEVHGDRVEYISLPSGVTLINIHTSSSDPEKIAYDMFLALATLPNKVVVKCGDHIFSTQTER